MKAWKWMLVLCLAAMLLCCAACGEAASAAKPAESTPAEAQVKEDSETPAQPDGEHELHFVEIEVQDYGTINLVLDATAAPLTVQNFLELAESGFYDGLTFHRIMDGFMIQGGDPDGNGTGGSGTCIVGEFAGNGWNNPISHTAGVISMARATDPNSASSQFFITVADATFLDGQYAAFGWVDDAQSLEIVQQIAKDAKPIDNNGTIPASEQPVITSIVVID